MKSRIAAGAVALAFSVATQAQDKYEVKVATFVGPQHFMNKWLEQWGGKLEKASNARLAFKFFHGAQMAPAPAHYDLARSGQAVVSWFLPGGTPVGVPPPDQLEMLQKGTLDGVFIDYGGAGIAFKMGGTLKYSTEMYSYVSSFGVAMNPDFYRKLPADLRKLVDDSTQGVEKEVGEGWDALDAIGKKLLVEGGSEPIKLPPQEDARFRRIGDQVIEAKLKELEDRKLPARAVYKQMKSLSEKHAKTSKNFWAEK